MAKGEKCPDCPPPAPAWLTTFSDLMSLLLTFFVLLLSFSTTKTEDFKKAIGSLQGALGVLHGDPILTSPVKLHIPVLRGDITEARPTTKDGRVESDQDEEAEGRNVKVLRGEEGIIIRIRDNALFDSGKADIKEDALPLLNRIGSVIARLPNPVEIEGHTDDVPIHTKEFPNNFWLSNARALKVLDLFVNEVGIAPQRLSAIGYGEFRPLVPNDSPENRARNRRVEIRIRYEQGKENEASPEEIQKLLEEVQLAARE